MHSYLNGSSLFCPSFYYILRFNARFAVHILGLFSLDNTNFRKCNLSYFEDRCFLLIHSTKIKTKGLDIFFTSFFEFSGFRMALGN